MSPKAKHLKAHTVCPVCDKTVKNCHLKAILGVCEICQFGKYQPSKVQKFKKKIKIQSP